MNQFLHLLLCSRPSLSSTLNVECNCIQWLGSRGMASWDGKPTQPIYKVWGLDDVTFEEPTSSGHWHLACKAYYTQCYMKFKGSPKLGDWAKPLLNLNGFLHYWVVNTIVFLKSYQLCLWTKTCHVINMIADCNWRMGGDQPKSPITVLKWPNKRQRHSSVGSTTSPKLDKI